MRTTQTKIVTSSQLREKVKTAKLQGRSVVFANGCFDTLHVGHVRYLQSAKEEGDVLIVGVNSDTSVRNLKGPKRPILDEMARAQLVAALRSVDYVVVFPEVNVERLLEEVRPDVHAKGTDYTLESVPERAVANRLAIRVAIVGDAKDHSTRAFFESIRKDSHG